MKVDRVVQRRVLELCADQYPMSADPDGLIADLGDDGQDVYVSNVAYLDAHGLLDGALEIGADGSASWARDLSRRFHPVDVVCDAQLHQARPDECAARREGWPLELAALAALVHASDFWR